MPLANCQKCGRLYNKVLHELCPACTAEEEQDFQKVYAYLKEHGPTHIDVLHEKTGVEKKLIMKFLAEDRFEGVTVSYKCERCGASINSGKLCAKCAQELNAEIQKMRQEVSPQGQVKARAYLGYSSLDRYRPRDK